MTRLSQKTNSPTVPNVVRSISDLADLELRQGSVVFTANYSYAAGEWGRYLIVSRTDYNSIKGNFSGPDSVENGEDIDHQLDNGLIALKQDGGSSENVLGFGAVGDGVTNDTVAIQKAIDFAAFQLREIVPSGAYQVQSFVHVPPGTYLVNTLTLPSGVHLKGDSTASTVLLHAGGAEDVIDASSNEFKFATNVSDLSILGDGANTLTGISYKHSIRLCSTKRVLIDGCATGIAGEDSWTLDVDECYVLNARVNSIEMSNPTAVTISRCRLDNAGEHGLVFTKAASGNVGLGLSVSNCKIQSNQRAGIYCADNGSIFVENCFFEQNNRANNSWADIHVATTTGESRSVVVEGGFHTPGGSGGVTLRALHVGEAQNVTVNGMDVRGNAYQIGVELLVGVKSATIMGSNFSSVITDVSAPDTTNVFYLPETALTGKGWRFFNPGTTVASYDQFEMAAVFGKSGAGLVGVGAVDDQPALQGGGTGSNSRLRLNPVAGDVEACFTTGAQFKVGGLSHATQLTASNATPGAQIVSVGLDSSGGNRSVTMTNIANEAGRAFIVYKRSNDANTITITPGAGLVNGAANYTFTAAYGRVEMECDGTNWYAYGA